MARPWHSHAVLVGAWLLLTACGVAFARPLAGGGGAAAADADELGAGMSGDLGVWDALASSFAMIIVSEIGDETFIIAAIMAMRHPRAIVLAGALSALTVMTVLSTALGMVAPLLVTRSMVNRAAFVLYTFFGCRLMYIAYKADPSETMESEVQEMEEKLEAAVPPKGRVRRTLARLCTPIFLEAFVLTFLAEWGDRSQITTIALGAHKNPLGVTVGAVVGHAICTGLAVVGGRLLALKISQRAVAVCGGGLFLIFAWHALLFGAPGTR